MLAMVYLQQLRELGYQDVGLAFSGKDALAAVERRRPKLILLDIKLRGDLDGIGVAEIIRCRHKVPDRLHHRLFRCGNVAARLAHRPGLHFGQDREQWRTIQGSSDDHG